MGRTCSRHGGRNGRALCDLVDLERPAVGKTQSQQRPGRVVRSTRDPHRGLLLRFCSRLTDTALDAHSPSTKVHGSTYPIKLTSFVGNIKSHGRKAPRDETPTTKERKADAPCLAPPRTSRRSHRPERNVGSGLRWRHRTGGKRPRIPAEEPLAGRGRSANGDGTLSLVAYSTPREVYEEMIPLFQATRRGRGRRSSSSRSRPRASRAGPSRPGFRPTSSRFSLEPDITRLVDAGAGRAGLERPTKYNGHGHRLGRRLHRPRRATRRTIATWDDLLTRGRRGAHPESVHLRRRAVEHHGRLRRAARAGQERGRGGRVPAPALRTRPVQDKSARESLQTFSAARATSCSPTRTRRSSPSRRARSRRVRRPRPDDPDREPRRGDASTRSRRRRSVRSTSCVARGAARLRREGLPLGRSGGRGRVRLPAAVRRSSPSPTSAAGRGHARSSSTARTASWPASSRSWAYRPTTSRSADAARQRWLLAPRRAGDRAPAPSRSASRRVYLSVIVLIPLAAVVAKVLRGRLGRLLGGGHDAAGRGGARAELRGLAAGRRDQRRSGHADRLGAGARRVPRARASSTRSSTSRSRCRRSSPG